MDIRAQLSILSCILKPCVFQDLEEGQASSNDKRID